MKIGNINSITNATFIEQNGKDNTMIVHKNDRVITFDMVEKDMNCFLDKLRNSKDIEDSEKEIILEAEKCVHNKDQAGLIKKLKSLGKKTLDIALGIAESVAGSFLFEWFKSNVF